MSALLATLLTMKFLIGLNYCKNLLSWTETRLYSLARTLMNELNKKLHLINSLVYTEICRGLLFITLKITSRGRKNTVYIHTQILIQRSDHNDEILLNFFWINALSECISTDFAALCFCLLCFIVILSNLNYKLSDRVTGVISFNKIFVIFHLILFLCL